MAQLSVHFSGPMLFLIFKDKVEVLIPKSEGRPEGCHRDRSIAKPHYAWLTAQVRTPGKGGEHADFLLREQLVGADVKFSEGTGPLGITKLKRRFDLGALAKTLGGPARSPLTKGSPVCARITLRGGKFKRGQRSDKDWLLRDTISNPSAPAPKPRSNIDYDAVWTTSGPVTVRMRFRCEPADYSNSDTVVSASRELVIETPTIKKDQTFRVDVANMDPRAPENWQIPSLESQYPNNKCFVDHDFKWIYELFAPKGGWDKCLTDPKWGSRLPLPAPTVAPTRSSGRGGRPSCHGGYVLAADLGW